MNQEGQEIFDLKPFTKEEVAYFIDFEAQRQKELQRQN